MSGQSGRLTNKVALITGGAQGIGLGIAKLFAYEGAVSVIVDLQEKKGLSVVNAIRTDGNKAAFVKTDLCKDNEIKNAVMTIAEEFGTIDIIVNSARPKLLASPFPDNLDEWNTGMDILLKAPALVVKYALPYLRLAGGACVINLTSVNSVFICAQPLVYHVAKAGLIQLTRYLAYTLGPEKIRVNAVCPGLVDIFDEERQPLTSNSANRKVTELVVPLKRAASVDDIAEATLFLCSDAAAYITGHVLNVDGGETLGDHFHIVKSAMTGNIIQ